MIMAIPLLCDEVTGVFMRLGDFTAWFSGGIEDWQELGRRNIWCTQKWVMFSLKYES
jgi:hypothetical protein